MCVILHFEIRRILSDAYNLMADCISCSMPLLVSLAPCYLSQVT